MKFWTYAQLQACVILSYLRTNGKCIFSTFTSNKCKHFI